MEAELGRVLILLNKNIDTIKSIFEARFYAAYIDNSISWDEFCELCDITDRLFISDISNLKEAYVNKGVTNEMTITYKYDRLISVGLLTNEARLSGGIMMLEIDSKTPQIIIKFTNIGNMFCDIVFK